MTCPYCERTVPDNYVLCPHCGAPLCASSERSIPHAGADHPAFTPLTSTAPRAAKRSPLPLVLFLLLLAVMIAAGVFLLRASVHRVEPLAPAFSAAPEPEVDTSSGMPSAIEPEKNSVSPPEADSAAYLRAEDIFSDFSSRYYLRSLGTEELNTACLLYEAAMRFDEACSLPEHVTEDTLTNVFYLLELDCPELLQIDFGAPVGYTADRITGEVSSVTLPYRMTCAEYQESSENCMSVIESLQAVGEGMNDLSLEFLVYSYLTNDCIYDAESEHAENAYGALVNGRAKCDGVAYAVTWALRELGVPCISVAAYPADGSIGHAWNLVLLGGEYYALDITANLSEDGEPPLAMHLYCNVPNSLLLRAYPVLDDCILWCGGLPEAESMEMNYYVLSGQYVAAGANYSELLDVLFSEAYYETGYFALQFEDADDLRDLCAHISDELDVWQEANEIEVVYYSCTPFYEEGSNILYMTLEPDMEVSNTEAA